MFMVTQCLMDYNLKYLTLLKVLNINIYRKLSLQIRKRVLEIGDMQKKITIK